MIRTGSATSTSLDLMSASTLIILSRERTANKLIRLHLSRSHIAETGCFLLARLYIWVVEYRPKYDNILSYCKDLYLSSREGAITWYITLGNRYFL